MTDERFEDNIKRMLQGDKEGLKDIYQEYLPYIYTTILTVLKNKENAEDVTSDFFIRLWDKAQQYKAGSGHKGYMATIARNMAIDFIRKHKKEELTDTIGDGSYEDAGSKERINHHGTYGFQSENKSVVEDKIMEDLSLNQALELLKPAEREIIHMKIIGEFTFQEIAKILKIPMGTVTWRYQNAIKKLRRCGYE